MNNSLNYIEVDGYYINLSTIKWFRYNPQTKSLYLHFGKGEWNDTLELTGQNAVDFMVKFNESNVVII